MARLDVVKVPQNLVITSAISSGLTIVVSLAYIALCIVALIYWYSCGSDDSETSLGSTFFITSLYTSYIKSEACEDAVVLEGTTSAETVFVLVLVTLSASAVSFILAVTLAAILFKKDSGKYLNTVVFLYIGVCGVSLLADLTAALIFGIDYNHLTDILNNSTTGADYNYGIDVVRLAALLLAMISMKGIVYHAVQIIMFIMMLVYALEFRKRTNNQHPIHKMGALSAFEQSRSVQNDPWNSQHDLFPTFGQRSQTNKGFTDDNQTHSPMREVPRSDYSHRSYDRSESWQAQPANGGRPFSYLEEGKGRGPSPLPSPAWPREQWPPVPAPDYSPPPRRLKSALKPGYT